MNISGLLVQLGSWRQLTLDVRNQIGVTNFVIDLFFQKFRVMINI